MNKIFIDNEEVICDSSYKIEEELKNPSSVILDKVYPKRWKGTNKLLTDFYFPKDYSKCLIKDVTDIPAEEGEYATGTNLNINVDNTKEWDYKTKGNIEQNNYSGTNLMPNNKVSGTSYGITFTPNEDGTYLVDGQSNSTSRNSVVYIYDNSINIASGTYYCIPTEDTNCTITLNVFFEDNTNRYIDISTNSTITINKNVVRAAIYVQVRKGSTKNYNKFKVYPMLSTTPVTKEDYEPYVGGNISPSPDYPQDIKVVTGEQNVKIVGKNLFDKNKVSTYTFRTNATINNDKSVTITATGSNPHYCVIRPNVYLEANTTYRISFDVDNMNGFAHTQMFINNSATAGGYSNTNSVTYTPSVSRNVALGIYLNANATITISNIQIEKGNITTSYEPYQEQNYLIDLGNIELCKIGDYKDYIYKQNDNWYLHKEINKIILDGTESWNYVSGTHPRFTMPKSDIALQEFNVNAPNIAISDYFKASNWYSVYSFASVDNAICSHNSAHVINIKSTQFTSLNDFKTWLSRNNTTVYYVMENSIDTQITNTTLIQQLDNLKNATLFNRINNISVDGDLPVILDLHYNYVTARTEEELIFAGIVKNSGNMVLNPRKPHYCSLQILDYSTLLSESDTLDYVISNKTIPEAIEQVIGSISNYGFVIGNINIKDTTSIIGAYSTLDKTPYDVFEYLSEISQSVWFTRMIDENTIAIDFYDVDYLPQNDDIEYTREYFDENKINNIEYDYSTNDYRNKQIIKSSQVYGNVDYVETIIASGYDKTFNTSENIGIINSIKVNGVNKTIGTNVDKEIGLDADFYYSVGMNTFESNENSPTYSAGTTIVITYIPLIKGRSLAINNSEVSRINNQIQRRGTITRYENRDDILSAEELNKVAQSYIKTYSNSEISLKLNSSKNFLNIGSKIFFNAPLEELKKEYLVKKKTTIIKQGGDFSLIKYQYELSSTFNLNNEINYFDNQRRKSEGNISTGKSIDRNIDVESTANVIFYDLEVGVSQ